MISFKQYLTEASNPRIKRELSKPFKPGWPTRVHYDYEPKEIAGHKIHVHSSGTYHVKDGKPYVHHTFAWHIEKPNGDYTYERGQSKHLKKHGLAVWTHVHRAVKEMIHHAKENNEIDSADLSANSRTKAKIYRKVAHKLGRETGAKRVDPETDGAILRY